MRLVVSVCAVGFLSSCATARLPLTCIPCEAPCAYPCSAVAVPAPAPKAVAQPAPAPPPVAPAPVARVEAPPAPAAAPQFSPEPGSFVGTQHVTLSTSTPGAVIHYTTDGSTPTAASPVYTGPIAVDRATTVKALAIAPGAPASRVMSGAFDVAPPPATPARVVVTKEKLELKEKVFFDSGKATIKPVSYALLDEVAAVLRDHAEVKRVRIEGHTDNVGDAAFNKRISQQRAEAVRAYLRDKGVDGSRLDAAGYGQERPIAPNTTAKGREANRRVEFSLGM